MRLIRPDDITHHRGTLVLGKRQEPISGRQFPLYEPILTFVSDLPDEPCLVEESQRDGRVLVGAGGPRSLQPTFRNRAVRCRVNGRRRCGCRRFGSQPVRRTGARRALVVSSRWTNRAAIMSLGWSSTTRFNCWTAVSVFPCVKYR